MALFEEADVTVETLVGEGKKFKTVDDLARGKAESDLVIAAREVELNTLRQQLKELETANQLLAQKNTPPPQSERPAEEPKPAAAAPSFTDEDLKARIKEVTQGLSAEQRREANVAEVKERLITVYGDEAKAEQAIAATAQELGVSVKFLLESAAQSPKAFYAQVGLTNVSPNPTPGATHGDVNTQAFGLNNRSGPEPGTYSFYKNILKEQGPTAYFQPEVQQAIMKAAFQAAKDGRDFYKS